MLPIFQVVGDTLATYWLPLVILISMTTSVASERSPLLATLTLKLIGPQLEPPPLTVTLRLASENRVEVGVGVGVGPGHRRAGFLEAVDVLPFNIHTRLLPSKSTLKAAFG
jgi:hypothetical protein